MYCLKYFNIYIRSINTNNLYKLAILFFQRVPVKQQQKLFAYYQKKCNKNYDVNIQYKPYVYSKYLNGVYGAIPSEKVFIQSFLNESELSKFTAEYKKNKFNGDKIRHDELTHYIKSKDFKGYINDKFISFSIGGILHFYPVLSNDDKMIIYNGDRNNDFDVLYLSIFYIYR